MPLTPLPEMPATPKHPSARFSYRVTWGLYVLLTGMMIAGYLGLRYRAMFPAFTMLSTFSVATDGTYTEGYSTTATPESDGTVGYLYFDALGQHLRTPELTSHRAYRVTFSFNLYVNAGATAYDASVPSMVLRAYDKDGHAAATYEVYDPQLATPYTYTVLAGRSITSWTLTFVHYADLGGLVAYLGLGQWMIEAA